MIIMKRSLRNGAVLLLLIITAALTGCGGSVNVSTAEFADALKSGIAYKDDLSQIDLDTAGMFYNFGDASIDEAVFYESSGATAEEIAVIKCSTEADAGKVETILKNRVNEQIESYKDYVPEEVGKLNAAVVSRKGNCAVLSVSDEPDKAREIIKSYLK